MCLLTEFEHYIVWVTGVTYSIGASQQHLEWNVWDGFTQLSKAFPRTLIQKAQRYIKCCPWKRRK